MMCVSACSEFASMNAVVIVLAPVAGKVSRAEITVGNLVAAGAASPPLTSVVSVSPVYASFDVDEQSYLRYTAPGASGGGWLIGDGTKINGVNAYLHLDNKKRTFGPYFGAETVGKAWLNFTQETMEAGAQVAKQVGDLVSAHVIARPEKGVLEAFFKK